MIVNVFVSRRSTLIAMLLCLGTLANASPAWSDATNGRLDVYFIDVEGGAATLIVTPAGESLLIDSGYPDNNGRDRDRILEVVRNVAGLSHIDHAFVSHWHLDHYGNHAALASSITINNFWDRGIPDALREDTQFQERIANYRAATQNKSRTLKVGDEVPLKESRLLVSLRVMTASRDVVANTGPQNPFADRHMPREEDTSDNAASLSLLLQFGNFRFLCCGDLTWNMEARLVTPNNPLGQVDLFMVTHHGLPSSNNPALVLAIDPTVAVMCNGPKKGGAPETIRTLREVKSLEGLYQLHRNVSIPSAEQTPAEFIANSGGSAGCEGVFVKASVAPNASTFTVQIGTDEPAKQYHVRDKR